MSSGKILRLGKDTLVYGIGGVTSKFLNIFLLPVLTRLFTLEQYGTIDLITLIVTFFTTICILGMDSAIGVYYFEPTSEENKKEYFASYFWSVTGLSLAFALISILLAPFIAENVLKDKSLTVVFQVASLTIPASIIYQGFITFTRFQFRPALYNAFVVVYVGLNVGLAIVLVKYLSLGIVGIFWARILAAAIIILMAFALQYKNIGTRVTAEKVKELITYGLPIVPLALVTYISNGTGRYFLKYFWTDVEIGKYAFAIKLSAIAGIGFTAFNLAFLPYASKLRFEAYFHEFANKIVKLFLFGSGCLILTLYSLSGPLVKLFGTKEYFVSEPYFILGMNILFLNAVFQVFNIGVCYAKKTMFITISQSIAMAANILLSLLLVPQFEVLGAMMAYLISLLTASLLIFAMSQSIYPIKYENNLVIELLLIIVAFGVASFWVTHPVTKIMILSLYLFWGIGVRKYVELPNVSEFKLLLSKSRRA